MKSKWIKVAEPAQPEDLFYSELLFFVPALGDYLGTCTSRQEHTLGEVNNLQRTYVGTYGLDGNEDAEGADSVDLDLRVPTGRYAVPTSV